MKKLSILISMIFASAFLFSCGKDGPPPGVFYWGHGFGMGYMTGLYDKRHSMKVDLALTEAQEKQIAEIDSKYRRLYYDNRGDFDKIDALRGEHRASIESVLNETQKKKYRSAYDSRWRGWGRRHGHHHMGDYYGHGYGLGCCSGLYENPGTMKKELSLEDDQVEKIRDIDSQYRALYYKNRGNYDRIDSLRLEHREAIEKILSPEQRVKYSDAYESRWRGWGPRGMIGTGMMR